MMIRLFHLAAVVAGMVALTSAQGNVIVIRGATVIDGSGAAPVAGITVVIEGNRIKDIGSSVQAPAGARTIDAKGKFLIPGLIDAHIHLRGGRGSVQSEADQERDVIRALHSYLYAGVTMVFDAGNRPDYIMGLRAKERSGTIVSPRILATGGSVASPNGHGGPQINQLPDALLETIIRYYHSKGVRVIIQEWIVDPVVGIDFSGFEQEVAPRHMGTASTYVNPTARIRAGLDLVYLGPYWLDAANTTEYGGHALVNLRGQFELTRGLRLFARVLNAGNRKYAESGSFTLQRGREFAPGRPRTVFAGAEVEWRRP